MKVLQVIRRLDSVSGSPIQVATLSKYLSETGHPTSIATAFPPHSDLDFSVDVHVIAPNTKNGTSYGKSSAFTAALVDLCEVLQPDIIHAHYAHSMIGAMQARAFLGIPYIVTLHGFEANWENAGGWRSRTTDMALSQADRITCITQGFLSNMIDSFPSLSRKSVSIIPDAVDDRFFRNKLTRQHGAEPIVFLYAGRLAPDKGVDILLHAFQRVNLNVGNAKLLILGDGAQRTNLERLAVALDIEEHVEFRGLVPLPIVASSMASSDVFVLPSRYEALGSVLLQAMASGLPVVATNVGGIPEIVASGRNGLLVEPESVHELADSMTSLVNDKQTRVRMGTASIEMATRYSIDRIAGEFLDNYTQAISSFHSYSERLQ